MKNVQLITTSIEEKIKDCEIVYLGNWCKNNDYIISEGKVCKYHWDDRIKLENDNNYLVKFYENILLELSNKLNKIHNTKYSIEYWRINLGHWLFCYLCSIFDRWENVKICLNQYEDVNFFKKYDFGLLPAPKTTREFMNLATDTKWNHLIYSKIIEFLNKKEKTNIKIIYEILKNEDFYYNYKPDVQHKIKSYLINLYSQIFGMFIKKNKIILYKTYFGKLNEFILNLKYKQLPFVLSERKFYNKINFELRNKLELDINPNNLFEKFVLANLFTNIPTEFLEDFNDIEKYIKRSKLPNNPKLIFTTRTLSKDNLFIRYCAIKKETGTKLVYGQHGGVYGQIKFCWVEDNEIKISDYYLTWGWESKNENKLLPFGILKKIDNFKFKKINELKKISYFMRSRPKYTNKIDSSTGTNQMSKYFKNCLTFFDQTELNLKKKIKIYPRFHEAEFGWNHYNIWKKKNLILI